MIEKKEIVKTKAAYYGDTKRFHRYNISNFGDENVAGSLYISKDISPFPQKVEIELHSK